MNIADKNKLLYSRAGFGWSVKEYSNPRPVSELVVSLFPKDAPAPLYIVTQEEWAMYSPRSLKNMTDQASKKEMQRSFRKRTVELNTMWVGEMAKTEYPLREKMSLFWHGHFAARIENPYYDQEMLHVIRTNALGSFKDLLTGVSKSSSMLQFLNNQQNRKAHPNENFAREVMELFTLGRGNYTEKDIKEAARAFTGWAFDADGQFLFRRNVHDTGQKTFLGKTGNFDGDDILRILLEQKQTALYITQKIYRFFVEEEVSNDKRVRKLADHFYSSNYNISSLLKELFTADWFYDNSISGAKIKSPVELLVGYVRAVPMEFKDPRIPFQLQRTLGQVLFYPPNVAGWPGGTHWIDSSSLIIRMRLPDAFFASKELDLTAKTIEGEMVPEGNMKKETLPATATNKFKVGRVAIDWNTYVDYWKLSPREQVVDALASFLVAVPVRQDQLNIIKQYTDNDTMEELIKSATILLMKTPEYQLA